MIRKWNSFKNSAVNVLWIFCNFDKNFDTFFALEFRECCLGVIQKSILIDYKLAHGLIYEWITTNLNVNNLINITPSAWDAMIRLTNHTVHSMAKREFFNCEVCKKYLSSFFDVNFRFLQDLRADSKILLEIIYSMIDFDNFQVNFELQKNFRRTFIFVSI